MAQSSATALSHRLRGQSAKALERPRATEAKGTGTEAADPRGVGGFDSDGLAAPAETTRTVSEVGINFPAESQRVLSESCLRGLEIPATDPARADSSIRDCVPEQPLRTE